MPRRWPRSRRWPRARSARPASCSGARPAQERLTCCARRSRWCEAHGSAAAYSSTIRTSLLAHEPDAAGTIRPRCDRRHRSRDRRRAGAPLHAVQRAPGSRRSPARCDPRAAGRADVARRPAHPPRAGASSTRSRRSPTPTSRPRWRRTPAGAAFGWRTTSSTTCLAHGRRDMAALMGALAALDRHSLATKRPITVPMLRSWLQHDYRSGAADRGGVVRPRPRHVRTSLSGLPCQPGAGDGR